MKRMIRKNQRVIALPAIFASFLVLSLISALTFAPVIKSNAAEESADVNVTVNPIISISLDKSTLSFDITPTSAGVFDSGSIVATVDTNSTGGYELYFSSEDSATAMTSLVSESTITSDFNSAVTSSSMLANKWGYSTDATNFNKIPALADQAKIKDLSRIPTSSEKDTTVTIGTKIDSTLPSGTYSKKVVFSAIAHPSLIPTLHTITTMQQMTPEICANTTKPKNTVTTLDWDGTHHGDNNYVPRNSLQDTRDGKHYLVSKLADGNCWMSQNLELMLDSTKALTNERTDLNTKTTWTPENSTFTEVPTTSTWPADNEAASSAAYSYYPIAADRYFQGGTTRASTPTNSGVEYDWEKAGIYYNWYSATAGSGTYAMTSGNAEDSICPKGWMLPLGTTENKSLYNLVPGKYGSKKMTSSPVNFLYAGYYNIYNGEMIYWLTDGHLWSSSVHSQTLTLCLGFYPSDNVQRYESSKGYGFNVRCVAR